MAGMAGQCGCFLGGQADIDGAAACHTAGACSLPPHCCSMTNIESAVEQMLANRWGRCRRCMHARLLLCMHALTQHASGACFRPAAVGFSTLDRHSFFVFCYASAAGCAC